MMKYALVAGGSKGIGCVVASELAKKNNSIIIATRITEIESAKKH
jgi:short-subunit dehydrogenase